MDSAAAAICRTKHDVTRSRCREADKPGEADDENGAGGLVALLGSCAIFVLLELELFLASDGIPDHVLFRSFFLIWVGYPIVFIGCIFWRIDKTDEAGTGGLFNPRLSVAKDLLYAMLDVWSKGVFAMWSVHTVFGAVPYYGASGIASKEF